MFVSWTIRKFSANELTNFWAHLFYFIRGHKNFFFMSASSSLGRFL